MVRTQTPASTNTTLADTPKGSDRRRRQSRAWGEGTAVLVAAMLATACGDDDGTSGGGGAGGVGEGGGAAGGGGQSVESVGCEGTPLLENPADTSLPGPWTVGARTASLDGLTVEVWYPAELGSTGEPVVYDIRASLPSAEQRKISDEAAPYQTCDCVRDLPIDATHGPYPVVLFVHGTAGFRTQSLSQMTHWASRGFIVMAADHPGLWLSDLIALVCGGDPPPRDLQADLDKMVAALGAPNGDLAFLEGHADVARMAMAGHSAGGQAIAAGGDVAAVLIPMAAGGVEAGAALEQTLILGGQEDQVVAYDKQVAGYESSPAPKRLVGLSPAGHLTFSSLCAITNSAGENLVEIGTEADVCGLDLAGALFDCDDAYITPERGWTIVNDATSAALEQTLHCDDTRAAALDSLAERYREVAEARSSSR